MTNLCLRFLTSFFFQVYIYVSFVIIYVRLWKMILIAVSVMFTSHTCSVNDFLDEEYSLHFLNLLQITFTAFITKEKSGLDLTG